jgi:hypothetical protein
MVVCKTAHRTESVSTMMKDRRFIGFRWNVNGSHIVMKIGFLGKQNGFALEMLRLLQCEHPEDEFSAWQPGDRVPSTELQVIFAWKDRFQGYRSSDEARFASDGFRRL